MALRRALARGLEQWGSPAGHQAAGLWTGIAGRALEPAKAHLGHSSQGITAAAAWQLTSGLRCLLRSPQLPSAAAAAAAAAGGTGGAARAAGRRAYSSSSSGGSSSGTTRETLQGAAQRIKAAAASSADAVKAVGGAVSKAPQAVYRVLPTSAKQLVNAAQTPGAVNRVVSLQLTAFWQNHSSAIIGGGAVLLCYAIWRTMYRTSQAFVSLSETMAASGFLALAAASVAFGLLWLRRRLTIVPQTVYRQAMYRLNTHPGLLEVMGAPLVGSPVQASVLTGGGIRFKGLRPKLQSKRLQMIFPLKGAERRGLVSLEAKKRHGELRFKLLAVDVPCVSGGEQRIYLEGGPALYERGGVLSVLRDPFIRALSMEESFVAEDEAEDAAEEREALAEAAAKRVAAQAKQPKPLDQGGGLYFYERLLLGARQAWANWRKRPAAPLPATGPPATGLAAAQPAAREQQPPAAAPTP